MKEKEIQKTVIKYITNVYGTDVVVIVNPMSDAPLPKNWSPERRGRFFKEMRSLGWRKSQPDVIIVKETNDFAGIAFELKRDRISNPTRDMRGGGVWLNDTKSSGHDYDHAIGQARYLDRLRIQGYFSCFAHSLDTIYKAIDHFLNDDPLPDYEAVQIRNICRYTGKSGFIYRFLTEK